LLSPCLFSRFLFYPRLNLSPLAYPVADPSNQRNRAGEEHDEAQEPPTASTTEQHLNTATSAEPIVDEAMTLKMPEPQVHYPPHQQDEKTAPAYSGADHARTSDDHARVGDVTSADAKHEPSTSPISAGTGTFASGSATVTGAPREQTDPTLHERAATAESTIPPEETAKILKTEAKDAKRISKIIQKEAKSDEKLLKAAIKELGRLQKVQKDAASSEASAISSHGKAIKVEQKLNRLYLDAKAKWEVAAADLNAKAEKLEAVKEHAQKQTELLQEKSREVEALRAQKATDDRERQAKLAALKNPALIV